MVPRRPIFGHMPARFPSILSFLLIIFARSDSSWTNSSSLHLRKVGGEEVSTFCSFILWWFPACTFPSHFFPSSLAMCFTNFHFSFFITPPISPTTVFSLICSLVILSSHLVSTILSPFSSVFSVLSSTDSLWAATILLSHQRYVMDQGYVRWLHVWTDKYAAISIEWYSVTDRCYALQLCYTVIFCTS